MKKVAYYSKAGSSNAFLKEIWNCKVSYGKSAHFFLKKYWILDIAFENWANNNKNHIFISKIYLFHLRPLYFVRKIVEFFLSYSRFQISRFPDWTSKTSGDIALSFILCHLTLWMTAQLFTRSVARFIHPVWLNLTKPGTITCLLYFKVNPFSSKWQESIIIYRDWIVTITLSFPLVSCHFYLEVHEASQNKNV